MAKKLKFDVKVVKQYVLDKGERVGLVVAAGLMGLFLVYGLMLWWNAKSPYEDINKKRTDLARKIDTAAPSPDDVKKYLGVPAWMEVPNDISPEEAIKRETARLTKKKEKGEASEEEVKHLEELSDKSVGTWRELANFDLFDSPGSWFDPGAAGDSKLRNPNVLPAAEIIAGDANNARPRFYVSGGVLTLAYDTKKDMLGTVRPAAVGGGPVLPNVAAPAFRGTGQEDNFARLLQPTRMIVVTTTFPFRDQLEVTRKALRKTDVKELLDAQLEPSFRGLIVFRWEVLPGGKTSDPQAVYSYDPAGDKTVVAMPVTRQLLTTAEYDTDNLALLEPYLVPGLATPLPRFMNAEYPKLELAGIDVKAPDVPGGERPEPGAMMRRPGPTFPGSNPRFPGGRPAPGPVAPGTERPSEDSGIRMRDGNPLSVSKLAELGNKFLQDKLQGNIDFFDPEGRSLSEGTEEGKIGQPVPMVRPAPRRPIARLEGVGVPEKRQIGRPLLPGPRTTGEPGFGDKAPEKVLVRFFDADVQPGKTYQYSIQVRMANPNMGKTKEVAYAGLAEAKELVSPPTITPPIRVPEEFFAYAVDVNPKELESKAAMGPKGTDKETAAVESGEATAIQFHRWVDIAPEGSSKLVVADWLIAERLLVHRGETLGRPQVDVEVPFWDRFAGAIGQFLLASSGGSSKGKVVRPVRNAIPVDFVPADRLPSVLVDFDGGKRRYEYAAPGKGANQTERITVKDDASTELLVLNPDGKLVVRTSRDDTDVESPTGRERNDRYHAWRNRINQIRMGGMGAGPGMPMPRGGKSDRPGGG
jgi:hypothetical protein